MTVYTFKGAPIVAPVSIETEEFTITNKKMNLKEDRLRGAGQRWLVSFGVLPTGDFNPMAYLMSGFTDPVTFNFPQPHRGLGPLSGALGATAANAGERTITVTAATYAGCPVGRFIKFFNHSKVYMVQEKLPDNQFIVYPNLVRTAPANTGIQYGSNVPFTALISSDQLRGVTFNDGVLEDYGIIKFVEDLP